MLNQQDEKRSVADMRAVWVYRPFLYTCMYAWTQMSTFLTFSNMCEHTWCVPLVSTNRCRETSDLILQKSSGAHMWKGRLAPSCSRIDLLGHLEFLQYSLYSVVSTSTCCLSASIPLLFTRMFGFFFCTFAANDVKIESQFSPHGYLINIAKLQPERCVCELEDAVKYLCGWVCPPHVWSATVYLSPLAWFLLTGIIRDSTIPDTVLTDLVDVQNTECLINNHFWFHNNAPCIINLCSSYEFSTVRI